MTKQKGFAFVIAAIVLGLIAAGGGAYVYMNPQILHPFPTTATVEDDGVQTEPGDHMEVDQEAGGGVMTKTVISWRLEDSAAIDGIPQTRVTAVVNGESHVAGMFAGSCAEVEADGGIDGKGLVAGELSAVQCYFAGGGNEIGVFAHEDGGFDIMVGEISEGSAEEPPFRGDFKIKASISL